jgi:Na+-transporting NADH:ubiquinone oxidoreductase subunit NqrB
MRILNQQISSLYLWPIALLSALVIISSYTLRIFPATVIIAVLLASILDIAISKFYHRHSRMRVPLTAIITGLIIGSIAPPAAYAAVAVAVPVAILSKNFIKVKNTNVFNPATLGLLTALLAFGVRDQWWIASSYNVTGAAVTLTPILIICAYKAKRLTSSLSFLAASLMISILLGLSVGAATPYGIVAALLSLNYLFAFVMIADPKTSPNGKLPQAAYGVSIAFLFLALSLLRLGSPFLIALLVGNIGYAVYRIARK